MFPMDVSSSINFQDNSFRQVKNGLMTCSKSVLVCTSRVIITNLTTTFWQDKKGQYQQYSTKKVPAPEKHQQGETKTPGKHQSTSSHAIGKAPLKPASTSSSSTPENSIMPRANLDRSTFIVAVLFTLFTSFERF